MDPRSDSFVAAFSSEPVLSSAGGFEETWPCSVIVSLTMALCLLTNTQRGTRRPGSRQPQAPEVSACSAQFPAVSLTHYHQLLFPAARSSRVVFSAWSSRVMFSRCLQSRGLLALFPSLPPAGVLELPGIISSSVTKVNLWVDWGPHLWLKACYVALIRDTCWFGSIFGAWPRVPALHLTTGDWLPRADPSPLPPRG